MDATVSRRTKEAAIRRLMKVIHQVEAAQNSNCVQACNGIISTGDINTAKSEIYRAVQRIERTL